MKWYWAITLTVAILAILRFVDAQVEGRLLESEAATPIIAIFAIWVAADTSSFGRGILVPLFWPIALPWYLIVRPKVLEEKAREDMYRLALKLDERGAQAGAFALYDLIDDDGQDSESARNRVTDVKRECQ